MGIQINGNTDTISATDGGLIVSGAELPAVININATGIITATSFSGDGSNLTGIDATQIQTGNTSVQTVDTGSDGRVVINTEGTERVRVDTSGNLVIKNPTSGGVYLRGIDTNGDEKILIGYESGTLVRIAEAFRVDFSAQSLEPVSDNAYDLGQADRRWRNIYSADVQLSNEGSSNDVDGTWGKYTIQEGENDLFLINRRTGKKYKFMLEEVE